MAFDACLLRQIFAGSDVMTMRASGAERPVTFLGSDGRQAVIMPLTGGTKMEKTSCQKVNRYLTGDGVLHETKEAAYRHAEDKIAEVFNAILRKLAQGKFGPFQVLNGLMENRDEIYKALMLEHLDIDDEE